MTVVRFDPFRGFDRLADQAWSRVRAAAVPLDATRRGDELQLEFDLPGVDPATIELTVEKGILSVTAERPTSRQEGDEVLVAERPTGRFTRQLQLGDGLDTGRVHASYDHGVLTVHLAVAEEVRPRRVPVQVNGAPVEATAEPAGDSAAA